MINILKTQILKLRQKVALDIPPVILLLFLFPAISGQNNSDTIPQMFGGDDLMFGGMMQDEAVDSQGGFASFLSSYVFEPKRLTLMHEGSYKFEKPKGFVNNRSSARLEYSKFFLDRFYLRLDSKLTGYWGNDHKAKAEDKDLLFRLRAREAFLQGSFGGTSIKAGIQVLVWGEADLMSVTDVISPRDYSEIIFIPVDELRKGQPMIAIDQFSKIGDWSFFFIPVPFYNEWPKEGTAYYSDGVDGNVPEQTLNVKDFEYGVKWRKTFDKSEISLMGTRLIDSDYILKKQRFNMFGMSFNRSQGNYLIRGELAYKSPMNFYVEDKITHQTKIKPKDVFESSLALEYSLGANFSASLQGLNTCIIGYNDEFVKYKKNDTYVALLISDKFFHDDLVVNWSTYWKVTNPFILHILAVSYQLNDHYNISLMGFYPSVHDNSNHMWTYRDQKQLNVKIQYQF